MPGSRGGEGGVQMPGSRGGEGGGSDARIPRGRGRGF